MKDWLLLPIVFVVVLAGCKKDDDEQQPTPIPTITSNTDTTDLSIRFTTYVPGSIYANDTIRNVFEIMNHGPAVLHAGDRLRTACRIGGITFALDLIGEGPTDLVLPNDLPVGGTYTHNPGYLLGGSLLDYFATDTVQLCVLVYGFNQAAADPGFPADPVPGNNTACLRYTAAGIELQ